MKQRLSRLWSNISVMTFFSVDTSLSPWCCYQPWYLGPVLATSCPGPNPLIHKFRITTLLSRDKDHSITWLKPASAQEIFKGLPKVWRKTILHEGTKYKDIRCSTSLNMHPSLLITRSHHRSHRALSSLSAGFLQCCNLSTNMNNKAAWADFILVFLTLSCCCSLPRLPG